MKKKVGFIFTFALVICSLFFAMPLSGTHAYEPTDEVDSKYLITTDYDNNEVYLSNEVAGKTSGYGDFIIDERDITLSTTAQSGFKIAGWQILYVDSGTTKFVDADEAGLVDGIYTQTVEIDAEYSVDIVINYFDENSNGIKNRSTFTISRVFDDLRVEPVFEYIYYKVQVDDAKVIGNLEDFNTLPLSSLETLYYETQTDLGDRIHYSNSYIETAEGLFYYGDVYSENVDSGDTSETTTRYFTIHYRNAQAGSSEKIDYSLGGFRINEAVDYNLNINTSSDLKNSVNIEIVSAEISSSQGITTLSDNDENSIYSVETDSYLRSTRLHVNFSVVDSIDQINYLNINYNNLYLVDVVIMLDGENATGTRENDILSVVNVDNYYSQVNAKQYFAKSRESNDSYSLRVSTIDLISNTVDEVTYNYYEFSSIDGVNQLYQTYEEITDNFEVVIAYNSVQYLIDFEFVVYYNDAFNTIEGDFNVEDSISFTRGEEIIINKTATSDNVGFNFLGFALSEESFSNNSSLMIQTDEERPVNITVYMVYEFIDYTITIRNFDQITLTNNDETYYAINQINLTHLRNLNSDVYSLFANDLRADQDKAITFSVSINLYDSITLNAITNNGFYIAGYKPNNLGSLFEGNIFSLEITQDTISQFAVDNNFDIYIFEEFTRYTVTYYIDPSLDTNTNQMVVMADIDVTAPEYANISRSFIVEGAEIDYSTRHEIVVGNLKLYDAVDLTSHGRTVTGDDGDYSYVFVRFAENDLGNLNYSVDEDSLLYTHSLQILRDISIKVVYSMQSSKLFVSLDNLNAYELSYISFYRNGTEELTMDETDNSVMVEEGELTIVLNPMFENRTFNFGYRLVGYTQTIGGLETSYETSDTTFTIRTIGSSFQFLELNFVEMEFRLTVSQYGGGYSGEYVEFSENQTYTSLDINNLTLEFNKPEGYYVSSTYFVNIVENPYPSIFELNEEVSSIFSYTFNSTQWEEIVETYGVEQTDYIQVDMRVFYSIYTFEITVDYELTNPKYNTTDLLVPYPNIALTYSLDNVSDSVQATREENTLTFVGVPYGSSVVLRVESLPSGFSSQVNWTMQNNLKPNNPPYVYDTLTLSISRITQNEAFKYKLDYLAYDVVLSYKNQGSPYVLVNDEQTNSVELYDNLKIFTEANKASGFQFKNLYYFRQEYVPYVYDEATWNESALSLYIYENDEYRKNDSYTYDENLSYFSLEDIRVDYSLSTMYEDTAFDPLNYKVENSSITFYIEYDYIQITIINNNLLAEGSASLEIGDLSTPVSDFTTYSLFLESDGELTQVENDRIFDYRDKRIIIRIDFNDIMVDGQPFNLSRGIDLEFISFLNYQTYAFTRVEGEDYDYELTLTFSDFIVDIPDSGELTINYVYKVETVTTTITTNIESSSFYYNDNGRIFYFQADSLGSSDPSFGGSSVTSGRDDTNLSLSYSFQFLGLVDFTFWFDQSTGYSQFFKITSIRVYNSQGGLIEDFSKYGIFTQRSGEDNKIIELIKARYIEDLTIELMVQPIIYYNEAEVINGDYIFTREFDCDNYGLGISQTLSIGTSSGDQIQTSELILESLRDDLGNYNVYYTVAGSQTTQPVQPTNVGQYELHFDFNSTGEFEWMDEIQLDYHVYLIITPLDVEITYSIDRTFEKTYDGSSSPDTNQMNQVIQSLVITDNSSMNLNYSSQYNFALSPNIVGRITYLDRGQQVETARANEDVFYNIYLTGLQFVNSSSSSDYFNINNFNLVNSSLAISAVIKINRKALNIVGLVVDDKVYDGSVGVTISDDANVRLSGVVGDDDANLVIENIRLSFENPEIGENKNIIVEINNTLTGEDSTNYRLNPISGITATIYPYSVSTYIEGFGEIEVINQRGLTDQSKVSLIPIGATLKVGTFDNDSSEYLDIYNIIANYLSNGRVFEIGLVLSFEQNGIEMNLPKDLYISLPKVDRLTNVVYLTGQNTGDLTYVDQGETILIDLNQINDDIDTLFVTKQRLLLKLWQIILIIFLLLLLIIIIIIIVLVLRKKRKERYQANDVI